MKVDDINENTKISDLIESFPYLVEFMQEEYGFHCVNCIFSSFDTLKNGAEIHGIIEDDFDEMLFEIKSYVMSFESEPVE
jgi:hypothetical protein